MDVAIARPREREKATEPGRAKSAELKGEAIVTPFVGDSTGSSGWREGTGEVEGGIETRTNEDLWLDWSDDTPRGASSD